MRASICLVLGIAGGCGDGRAPAMVTLPPDPDALLTLVQDGDGEWREVSAAAGGVEVEVESDRFGHAHVCWQRHPASGEPAVGLHARLMTLDVMALPPPCAPLVGSRLEGRVIDGARVHVGARHVTAVDGRFSIEVSPGVWDVAAVIPNDVGARFLVERAVDLTTDRTIELGRTRGVPLLPVPLAVSGGDDRTLTYGGARLAGGTRVRFNLSDGGRAWLLPPQLVAAGDRSFVGAVAHDTATGTFRTTERVLVLEDLLELTLAIPEPVLLELSAGHARWAGVWDGVAFEVWSPVEAGPLSVSIEATAAWLADGAAQLRIPAPDTMPGWDAAWGEFAAADTLMWSATVWRGDPDGDVVRVRRTSSTVWP